MKKHLFIFFMIFMCNLSFSETIKFNADAMSGSTSSASEYTCLEGNASVTTDSMSINADKIELSGKDFTIITATGTVKGSNTETKMEWTCGKLTYNRDTKVALLENSVHLIDQENNVTADAQIIEYDQDKKLATMQISVSLTQKDNKCNAAYAIYDQGKQILQMRGNPRLSQGNDTFRAQEIDLNLDTQEITLNGRVQGSVTTNTGENK